MELKLKKKFMARVLEAIEVEKPSFLFSLFGSERDVDKDSVAEYFEVLDLISKLGIGVLHMDYTFSSRWNNTTEIERTDCRGD